MNTCPKCKETSLKDNDEWDRLFDRAFDMTHDTRKSSDLIIDELENTGVYFAKCQNSKCGYVQMRNPNH